MELLFDLDGTLTDPAPGITGCIAHALERLGRPVPARGDLERFIGPPLAESFAELLGSSEPEAVDEAIAIFQLNVSAYPEAFNTYDSLGEAYMTTGEVDLAIANYERSLKLNPDNSNAVAMLEKLRR